MRCADVTFVRTPLFAKRENNILPYGVTESFIKNGRGNPSPTDKEGCSPKYGTDIFITLRGDSRIARHYNTKQKNGRSLVAPTGKGSFATFYGGAPLKAPSGRELSRSD